MSAKKPRAVVTDYAIRIDNTLDDPRIIQLLEAHLLDMRAITPAEHVHALELDKLRATEITFWVIEAKTSLQTAHQPATPSLAGCAALKHLNISQAEIKSMRISPHFRGQGLATRLLDHIIQHARMRQYQTLLLETGTHPFFAPAAQLYQTAGFQPSPPFADYQDSPDNQFMQMAL